ncbi:hypothetical protein HK096_004848 [Nowakowskiella sp. JEL0078]|nr:hypothetical protein HK096_004848 [Nowakowskiella sp. JEL0078]
MSKTKEATQMAEEFIGFWEPLSKLGEGAQGEVFLGRKRSHYNLNSSFTSQNLLTKHGNNIRKELEVPLESDSFCAIKREPRNCFNLRKEFKIYKSLYGIDGIPRVFMYEEGINEYNVLVMEALGPTLKAIKQNSRTGKLEVCYTAAIGLQLVLCVIFYM